MDKQRTNQQNKAIHLWFKMLADELNNAGLYITSVIRLDAPWNEERVKELLWRTTQKSLFGKKSTTELTVKEINQVFEVINKGIGEKGLHVPLPSMQQLLRDQDSLTN